MKKRPNPVSIKPKARVNNAITLENQLWYRFWTPYSKSSRWQVTFLNTNWTFRLNAQRQASSIWKGVSNWSLPWQASIKRIWSHEVKNRNRSNDSNRRKWSLAFWFRLWSATHPLSNLISYSGPSKQSCGNLQNGIIWVARASGKIKIKNRVRKKKAFKACLSSKTWSQRDQNKRGGRKKKSSV